MSSWLWSSWTLRGFQGRGARRRPAGSSSDTRGPHPSSSLRGDRTLPGLPRPLVSVLSHVLTSEGSLQMLLNASPQHPSRSRPLVLSGCSTLTRSRLQGKGGHQACCMHCCASCCVHRHDPAPGLGNAALQGIWGDMTDHRANVSSRLMGKGSRLLAPGTLSHPA